MKYVFTGLFSGAGGLDLGFEMAGFQHAFSTDLDEWSIKTLKNNRPGWDVVHADIKEMKASEIAQSDVLLAGFPCQGFSLGGNRQADDVRNQLFKEVIRIAKKNKPKIVLIENVLNLRTMADPFTKKPFAHVISEEFEKIGYNVKSEFLRVSNYGVPQTRRRFILIASLQPWPKNFAWPYPEDHTPASAFLGDIAANPFINLPNHNPEWGFKSRVHIETGEPFNPDEMPVPCRFSRTGSDGNPIRDLDAPFPAVDTATIWGWAQGNVTASRESKDRKNGKFIRNPNIDLKLWRIKASRLRSFTDREYARLQTFPDSWVFYGGNKRHIHQQIGNAVPVQFAYKLGIFVKAICTSQSKGQPMQLIGTPKKNVQLDLL